MTPPTHAKLEIELIQTLIRELRRLPMEHVEGVVNALRKAEPIEPQETSASEQLELRESPPA